MIEAIFTVIGLPVACMWQIAVSIKKLCYLLVSHMLILLGFQFKLKHMTVLFAADQTAKKP